MDVEAELAAFSEARRDDLARLLMAASAAVSAQTLASLDPEETSGVRTAHVPVIAALEPGGSRMVDLARRIGHTRQSVAALVKDLEAAGVVAIEPDPEDGRATRVMLTEQGAAFCHSATAAMREAEHAWRAELGDAEVDLLRVVLRSLRSET